MKKYTLEPLLELTAIYVGNIAELIKEYFEASVDCKVYIIFNCITFKGVLNKL